MLSEGKAFAFSRVGALAASCGNAGGPAAGDVAPSGTITPPLTSSRMALGDDSVARLLRVCDLACQRSGLRFRAARVALNDDRDDLLRSVAADVLGETPAE